MNAVYGFLVFSFRLRSFTSPCGTLTNRRANDLNRSIGLCGVVLSPSLTAPLASDLSPSRSRCLMRSEFLVCQSFTDNRRSNLPKAFTVIVLPFVEPEGLLVQITIQMGRVNADVGSLEGTFQEAPKILDVLGINPSTHKFDRMVNHFVSIGIRETEIGFERVGDAVCDDPI